jgi:hypothetical protein
MDGVAEKSVDHAEFSVELREAKGLACLDGEFTVSVSPQQFVYEIGHGDTAVARELKAP